MSEFVNLVRQAAIRVENGRTPMDILDYAMTELGELAEEIIIAGGRSYKVPGKDGVAGEAIDLSVCLVDLMHATDPVDIENAHYGLPVVVGEVFTSSSSQHLRSELHDLMRMLGTITADVQDFGISTGLIRSAVASCLRIVRRELPFIDEMTLCEMARPKLEKWVAKSGEMADA